MAFGANAVRSKRRSSKGRLVEGLIAFTTTSQLGDARAPGALHQILKTQSLPTAFAAAEQVHGSRVQVVAALSRPKKFARADGLVTEAANQPLAIFTADCVPLFLADQSERVIGILHAGWRGVRAGILRKAVRLIRQNWGISPRTLKVWAGPSIGACCFEVQWDVARYFPATRVRLTRRHLGSGGWTIDLSAELKRQAKRLRIRWVSKKALEDCTMHGSQHFSYRRDKTSKRQVSVIVKREKI